MGHIGAPHPHALIPPGVLGEMSVAQIKLPLDPAPRLVFQLAATIAIVNRLSLCLDQLKLYLVVELGELPAAAVASVLDLSQPFAEMRAVRPDDIVRKLALTRQLAEPLNRGLDRQASSNNLAKRCRGRR